MSAAATDGQQQQQPQGAAEALLVAVDDSEASDRAFDFAVRHLHRPGIELHLVHVVPRLHFAAA
jgi:nucleotide-binding universal stress UspA family protein